MHFRPGDLPKGDPTQPGTPVEWADNAVSNTFAWAAHAFVPNWCMRPGHFTARMTAFLFTDCPCCMLFRGLVLGAAGAFAISALVAMLYIGVY